MADLTRALIVALTLAPLGGCAGVTAKITGSARAGSEQLMLTGTANRAIDCVDFRPLAGARAYLDTSMLKADDAGWLQFNLRRSMARQGLLLVETRKDAQVVVEVAAAAYGTDEVDRRMNIPGANITPGLFPLATASMQTQAITRKSRQDAVVKLALAAYDVSSHRLVWESGDIVRAEALDRKFFGAAEISRKTTMHELEDYPRRSGL
ncbi:DUF6655 family protein [Isosphaeraceae bacterium EP7]